MPKGISERIPIAKSTGKPCEQCLRIGEPCSSHRNVKHQIVKTTEPTSLNPRRRLFVQEYLVDFSPRGAAIRAGYAESSASAMGQELLRDPIVAEEIEVELNRRAERVQITADRVIKELFDRATSNMMDYVRTDGSPITNLRHLTRSQAAAIQQLEVEEYVDGAGDDARKVKKIKLKLHDQKKALELLGKHLGLFSDRLELSGPGGRPIEVDHSVLPLDKLSLVTRKRIIEDLRSGEIDEGEVIEVGDGGRVTSVVESRIVDQPAGRPEWLRLPSDG